VHVSRQRWRSIVLQFVLQLYRCSFIFTTNPQGIWWIPEATDAQPAQLGSAAALRAAAAAAAGGGEGGLSGPELLKLAASMRMNTGGFDCGLRVGWEGGQLGLTSCPVPKC